MNQQPHRIMILDTETTGLNETDRVIELAYIIYEDGKAVETYNKLWKCTKRSCYPAQKVHKIPYDDVVNSKNDPKIEIECLEEKMKSVDRVVAHNLGFDEKMLRQTAKLELGRDFSIPNGFCTLKEFRKHGKNIFSNFKNTELFLKISGKKKATAHRALVDVEMTSYVYFWGFGEEGKFVKRVQSDRRTENTWKEVKDLNLNCVEEKERDRLVANEYARGNIYIGYNN
jgi:DNA polymerase III epsilon subunit-like protein